MFNLHGFAFFMFSVVCTRGALTEAFDARDSAPVGSPLSRRLSGGRGYLKRCNHGASSAEEPLVGMQRLLVRFFDGATKPTWRGLRKRTLPPTGLNESRRLAAG
jgi:hypothetical protein